MVVILFGKRKMKKLFNIECCGGNEMLSSFLLLANKSDVDDMVDHVNSVLESYNESDSDLDGHPMESALKYIRSVSKYNERQYMIDSYPEFGDKFYYCKRIKKTNIKLYELG